MKTESLKVDDKLPQGWAIAIIQELCKIQTGKKDVNQGNPNGQYYFFTCASEPLRSDDYIFDGESILLPGNGANVGLVLYYKGKFDLYQRTYALTNFLINGKYLYFYFLANWKNSLIDKQYGSATNYIRLGNITEFSIPIAPLNEQERIVAKLEKLLAKVNDSCDRLSRIPTLLKRFRQSVLASACSGRLTADWRKQHPNIEPAEELLKRIQGERIKRYEEECAKAKAEGRRKPKKPDFISSNTYDFSSNNDVSDTWVTCKIMDIFDVETGATPYRKEDKYWKNGNIPWIKTGEVHNCDILKAQEFITELALSETNTKIFPEETILIAMYGEGKTRGQTGRLKIKAATNQACAALVNSTLNLMTIDYIYLFTLSQYYEIRRLAVGGNQPNLNLDKVKNWQIELPPLEEQKEIVRRVQALFKKCDLIEQRYLKAKTYTDKLTQSILAKAFRGELVPQDPNDEPAEVLLERIREEKALTEKSSKGKKRSKSKTT